MYRHQLVREPPPWQQPATTLLPVVGPRQKLVTGPKQESSTNWRHGREEPLLGPTLKDHVVEYQPRGHYLNRWCSIQSHLAEGSDRQHGFTLRESSSERK